MPRLAASFRLAALSPMARMAAGGGPTQRPGPNNTTLGEVGVLGEKAEAGMEGVGVHVSSGRDHGLPVQEVDGVRAVRGRGYRSDAESIAGPGDPCRDLTLDWR